MIRFFFILMALFGLASFAKASHIMGGEITWIHQNGKYVFSLVYYRDCNGANVNTTSETISVWNHPTINAIDVPFVSRVDISPICKAVNGSPTRFLCGSGTSGGNGIGAIEKILYRSREIELNGLPPAQGWIFTNDHFPRSSTISNISNPSSYGMTISAKMFAGPGNSISDSSPMFLQEPHFVSCMGAPYTYNMHPVDPDLDSINISFGTPYNNLSSGNFNPPIHPAPIPFQTGFSYQSPTPSPNLSPGSISAQIDPQTGSLTFTSAIEGNFVVKLVVRSFRSGVLIAEVEREMQCIVVACGTENKPPQIIPPFTGNTSFTTTVKAGTNVAFNLRSTDNEFLQDGSPQQNILTASGLMFSNDFSSTTDCSKAPCATVGLTPPISGMQGVLADFNWQTSCDHLLGPKGNALEVIPYHFVFRIQDDYCNIPKVTFATVTINVVNPGIIQAPKIKCIQAENAGNVTIEWNSVTDTEGTFKAYQVYSLEDGLLASLPSINTTSWTSSNVNKSNHYYLGVVSGCNGNTIRFSDTLTNIFLDVINPSDGTALLNWKNPKPGPLGETGRFYQIYREYPTGTWTLRDSVPIGKNSYRDTIDICDVFLNYQISLPSNACNYNSNIDGGKFSDMLTPNIPVISAVSADTNEHKIVLTWNVNPSADTYGYVIYTLDSGGFLVELDTVWGNSNTRYSHYTNLNLVPLTYTVAAFDSCLTNATLPTYQTSAKAAIHTSIFLTKELKLCEQLVHLRWSPYVGWSQGAHYAIYGKKEGEPYTFIGQTDTTSISLPLSTFGAYCFFIKAVSNDSLYTSLSNPVCLNFNPSAQPAYHYLQQVSVNEKSIVLRHLVDASSGVKQIAIEKLNENGEFEEIQRMPVLYDTILFIDTDVEVENKSYAYRCRVVDSCGNLAAISNTARSILLQITKEETSMQTYLSWNSYEYWKGKVVTYRIYRNQGNGYAPNPLSVIPYSQRSYIDQLNTANFQGRVCYYIEAIEGDNALNDPKWSTSNEICEVFDPVIYIPNAFTPGGINPMFYPVISLYQPVTYEFTVFDRWGKILFQTTDPSQGWDGQIKETHLTAQPGTYPYIVKMHDGAEKEVIRRGSVTLMK